MSQYAKTLVAAVAAVLIAGVDAWQSVTAGAPFRPIDVLPIAVAVAGAVLTYVIPNVPELPAAKAVVSGVLAVLTAAATFATGHPADVTLLNLIVAGLGALLTWYVPNLPAPDVLLAVGKAAGDAATGHADLADVTAALSAAVQLDPTIAAQVAAAAPAPVTAPIPAAPAPIPAAPAPAAPVVDGQRAILVAGLAHLDALDAADAQTAELPAVPAAAPTLVG